VRRRFACLKLGAHFLNLRCLVLDEEEAKALRLSFFPHLFLPDMVEAHIANLNLQPVETKHEDVFERHDFNKFESDQSAFAASA
jgi:hypothetical protein